MLVDLGVPPANIIEIDEDLGRSAQAVAHRKSYLWLYDEIRSGRPVGVAAETKDRVGRRLIDLFSIIEERQIYHVPMFLDRRIYDATDESQRMLMQLKALLSQHSLDHQRDYMNRCRRAKAKLGKAVGRLPPGITKDVEGRPRCDKDSAAGAAIARVLRDFAECKSLGMTMRLLAADEVKIPVLSGKTIGWRQPTIDNVSRIIKNPLFAGRYVFRKSVADPRLGRDRKGHWRVRPARPEEQISGEGSFEGFITWEEFQRNQKTLSDSDPSRGRRPATENPALAQGRLRHVSHPAVAMTPKRLRERGDGSSGYLYGCVGTHRSAGKYCISINARHVDPVVLAEVKARLARPHLESVKAAYERARGDARGERFRLEVELRRVSEEEKRLQHLYTTESMDNSEIRAKLGHLWKEAIKRCESLRGALSAESSNGETVFDDQKKFAHFVALATDIDRLINEALPIERKQLVRSLVNTIWVESYSAEEVTLRIVWKDGSPDSTIRHNLRGHAYRRILSLDAEGKTGKEIVEILAAEELRTALGLPWSERLVNAALERIRKNGLPQPRKRWTRRGTQVGTELARDASDRTVNARE